MRTGVMIDGSPKRGENGNECLSIRYRGGGGRLRGKEETPSRLWAGGQER